MYPGTKSRQEVELLEGAGEPWQDTTNETASQ